MKIVPQNTQANTNESKAYVGYKSTSLAEIAALGEN